MAEVMEYLLGLGYVGVFLSLYIEHVFPPIPAQVVLPAAALLAGRGDLHWGGVLFAAWLGGQAGSFTLYALGRWTDARILHRYGAYLKISEEQFHKSLAWMDRYQGGAVFAMHAFPISPLRVMFCILAGMNKMAPARFLLWAGAGSFLWISLQVYLATALGANWTPIESFLEAHPYLPIVGGLALLFLAWLLWRWRRTQAGSI